MHCNAQKDSNTQLVRGKCFEGYIFPKTYIGFLPLENVDDRFTPKQEDILKAEEILKKQITALNKDLLNQTGKCPIVHKKLRKYKRQYVGIINESGEKVVWINLVWKKDKDALKKWHDEIIIILDGCSFYWNVKVNLANGKLFDLSINGLA